MPGTFDNPRDTAEHPVLQKTFLKANTVVHFYLGPFSLPQVVTILKLMYIIFLASYHDVVKHVYIQI